jgi:thiosulfate/3-mercaptopyruvate sulfurtransferase
VTVRDDLLVDAAALRAALDRPDPPTVLDVRWRLGAPGAGRQEHAAGHVPGAAHLDLDDDLSGPPGAGGRHPLPDPAALQAALRRAGVLAGHPVVVYDGGDGLGAARAWWVLRWAGHRAVRVLDGGLPAWVAAGGPVTAEPSAPAGGDVTVAPGSLPSLTAEEAAELAVAGTLIDARVGPRYRGEVEPLEAVAGHVPGAVNLPAAGHADAGGLLRPADEQRAAFAAAGVAPDRPVGAYCGSGITAARTVLALHLAGRTDAALYVGSWSDWVTGPARPVATGESP